MQGPQSQHGWHGQNTQQPWAGRQPQQPQPGQQPQQPQPGQSQHGQPGQKSQPQPQPPVGGAEVDAKPRDPKKTGVARFWFWFLFASVILLVAGAFVGGAVLGWRHHANTAAAEPAPGPTVVTVTAVPEEEIPVAMPDIRGLSETSARQVIADAGIVATIETSTKQWAGAAGLVVEQTPVFGTPDVDSIELVLSTPAVVPDAVGRPASDVAREISALGAQVTLEQTYEAGAAAGSVLEINPAAGEALPGIVEIKQATPASAIYLREVRSLQDDCRTGEVKLNGPTHAFGMTCSTREVSESVWLLSRVVDGVDGVVGIPDTADPAMTGRIEIIVDGTVVLDQALAYGQAAIPIELDTQGALRFTLRITNTSEETNQVEVGFGDLRLTGETTAITGLGEQ